MKFLYYILHTFIECGEDDLDWYKDAKATCNKCGRVYFIFRNFGGR